MPKKPKPDATPVRVRTKGATALVKWRGKRKQYQVHDLLELDAVSYNRYERGARKPSLDVAFEIERLTNGAVPAKAWHEFETVRSKRSA